MKLEHYADYVLTSDNKEVQNAVAVQRKTIGEVLSQFKDIQTRLPELEKYGVPWLLVEEQGMFINANGMLMSKRGKLLYETGVKAQSYFNFLHSVQRGGTSVKTTLNWEQSVWWLYSLHSYIQREHIPKSDRKYTQKEDIIGALMSIVGVGKETTDEIWDCYCAETSKEVTNLRIDEDALSMILVILLELKKVKEEKAADRLENKEIAAEDLSIDETEIQKVVETAKNKRIAAGQSSKDGIAAVVSATEIAQIFNITEEKKLRKLRKMLHRLTEKKKLKRKKVDGAYKYTIAADNSEIQVIAAILSTIEMSSVSHKNVHTHLNIEEETETPKTDNVSREAEIGVCDEEDEDYLREIEEEWKTIDE